jgi:IS30 family transposase
LRDAGVVSPGPLGTEAVWEPLFSSAALLYVDAGIAVFFCDPHAPWQRGTNENTNGLLRQYFPKGFDFSTITEVELDAVADELNERPRKRFGFATPTEQLSELLLR